MEINVKPPLTIKKSIENNKANLNEAKAIDFFKDLYSYPVTVKVKSNLDDLLDLDNSKRLNLTDSYDYEGNRVTQRNGRQFIKKSSNVAVKLKNTKKTPSLVDGYLDNGFTSQFYTKKVSTIKNSLRNIPIYVILNSQSEIALASPSNVIPKQFVKENLYNFLGNANDSEMTRESKLGLFFTSYKDAEFYLEEILRSDNLGASKVGVSICKVGLDLAYELMREHHPGFDFRFVADFNEVVSLLETNFTNSNLIFEELQMQIRDRGRTLFQDKVKNNEYFKGVPIYFVQLQTSPRNIAFESALKFFGIGDTMISGVTNKWGKLFGYGNNLMLGSLDEVKSTKPVTNFIFFEYKQALEFTKKQNRYVSRYLASQTKVFAPIIRKPKIFITNLEDFLELWERKLLNDRKVANLDGTETIFDASQTIFVPPTYKEYSKELDQNLASKGTLKYKDFFSLKYKIFKSSISSLILG